MNDPRSGYRENVQQAADGRTLHADQQQTRIDGGGYHLADACDGCVRGALVVVERITGHPIAIFQREYLNVGADRNPCQLATAYDSAQIVVVVDFIAGRCISSAVHTRYKNTANSLN